MTNIFVRTWRNVFGVRPGPAAKTAARWWTERLRSIEPNTTLGDGLPQLQASTVTLQTKIRIRERMSEDDFRRFERELGILIEVGLRDTENQDQSFALGANYAPGYTLSTALEAIGLDSKSTALFPWKTGTRVFPDKVTIYVDGIAYKDLPVTA